MSKTYIFGSPNRKERLDLWMSKLTETSERDRQIITNYLKMRGVEDGTLCRADGILVGFYPLGGKFDPLEWDDVTVDVLIYMFESGYVPKKDNLEFLFKKFDEADKVDELADWIKKWW